MRKGGEFRSKLSRKWRCVTFNSRPGNVLHGCTLLFCSWEFGCLLTLIFGRWQLRTLWTLKKNWLLKIGHKGACSLREVLRWMCGKWVLSFHIPRYQKSSRSWLHCLRSRRRGVVWWQQWRDSWSFCCETQMKKTGQGTIYRHLSWRCWDSSS